jgi:hypothetical protein
MKGDPEVEGHRSFAGTIQSAKRKGMENTRSLVMTRRPHRKVVTSSISESI